MSLKDSLQQALDEARTSGEKRVEVHSDGVSAAVDLDEVDGIGVRVRGLRVTRGRDIPLGELAQELPQRVRSLPDRVMPIEVDESLRGGVFRTPVDPVQSDFYQLDVRGRDTDVRRYVVEGDERTQADFTMTRDALGRLVDELG